MSFKYYAAVQKDQTYQNPYVSLVMHDIEENEYWMTGCEYPLKEVHIKDYDLYELTHPIFKGKNE